MDDKLEVNRIGQLELLRLSYDTSGGSRAACGVSGADRPTIVLASLAEYYQARSGITGLTY
jgi:hypothetical protein